MASSWSIAASTAASTERARPTSPSDSVSVDALADVERLRHPQQIAGREIAFDEAALPRQVDRRRHGARELFLQLDLRRRRLAQLQRDASARCARAPAASAPARAARLRDRPAAAAAAAAGRGTGG